MSEALVEEAALTKRKSLAIAEGLHLPLELVTETFAIVAMRGVGCRSDEVDYRYATGAAFGISMRAVCKGLRANGSASKAPRTTATVLLEEVHVCSAPSRDGDDVRGLR